MKPRYKSLFISLIALPLSYSASADTGTWTGGASGTWDTTDTNWTGVAGTPWAVGEGAGNIAIFNTVSLAATVGENVYVNGITFSASGSLAGSVISLSGANPSITVDALQTATISSVIAGTAPFTKIGDGILVLSGSNTYIGGTTVSAGRLRIVDQNGAWTRNIVTNAELEFNINSSNPAISGGTFSGSGSLIKTGAGTLQLGTGGTPQTIALTGASSLIDVQAGILKNDHGNSAWTGNLAGLNVASGATFDTWDGNTTVDELSGSGVINKGWVGTHTLTIGANNGSGTFSGNITNTAGSLNLTKIGSGTQTLNGTTLSYNGITTVSAGKLILVNSKTGGNNFVSEGDLEFNTSVVLRINGGTISGAGNIIKSGSGTLQLGNNGSPQTIALTGASTIIDVQGGILKNDWGNSAWSGNKAGLTVASGAIFDVWDGNATVDELNGAGRIRKNNGGGPGGVGILTFGVNNGNGVFSGIISSSAGTLNLVKEGSGTQEITGSITSNGSVTINGGRLKIVDGAIGKTYTTNAQLELNVTTGSPAISGGTISGTGSLIKSGAGTLQFGGFGPTAQTIALSGANSIIDVQEGILKNDYFNSAWSGNLAGLTVASGAFFDTWDGSTTVDELNGSGVIRKSQGGVNSLTFGVNNGSGTFSGQITNSGGTFNLIKIGSGTQTLGGVNNHNGTTAIDGGKLVVTGSITNSAVTVSNAGTTVASGSSSTIGTSLALNTGTILSPGDGAAAGTITVSGATTMNNGSIFSWDISASGTSSDKLISTSFVDGDAAGGSIFRIVAADSSFGNSFWSTNQTWNDILTTDGSAPISNWANAFDSGVSLVDSNLSVLSSPRGSFSITGNTLSWTAVPEPTSALVGLLLGVGFLRRRRA